MSDHDEDLGGRYDEKPFLKLIDCYVLDAIGALDAQSEAALVAFEPKLHQLFETDLGWRQIVEAQMRFPADLQAQILKVWEDGRPKFIAANGEEPDPHEFTRQFVDMNIEI